AAPLPACPGRPPHHCPAPRYAMNPSPVARNTDPESSHEAAEFVTMSGKRAAQQQIAAKVVEQYPGLTSLELAKRVRMDRYMLARRLPECEAQGTVRRGQIRRCSKSGRLAATWYPPGEVEQLALLVGNAA